MKKRTARSEKPQFNARGYQTDLKETKRRNPCHFSQKWRSSRLRTAEREKEQDENHRAVNRINFCG